MLELEDDLFVQSMNGMMCSLQLEIQSTHPVPGMGMTCETLYKSGDIQV